MAEGYPHLTRRTTYALAIPARRTVPRRNRWGLTPECDNHCIGRIGSQRIVSRLKSVLAVRASYISNVIPHIDSVVGCEYNEGWKLRTKQKCLTSHPEAGPKGLRFETAMPYESISAANDSSLLFGRVMPVLCLGLARNRWTGQGCYGEGCDYQRSSD